MKITAKLREQAADICAHAACNPEMILSDIAEFLGHSLVKGFFPSVELASAVWLEVDGAATGLGSRDPARDAEAEAMLRCGYIPTEWGDYE